MYVPNSPKDRARRPITPKTPDEKAPAILETVETTETNFYISDVFLLKESKEADLLGQSC